MDQLWRKQIREHLVAQFSLSEEQIEKMLPSFLATLAGHLEALEQSLQSNDLQRIGRAGHTIKGAFLNLGLKDCAGIAQHIEEQGKAEDLSTDYRRLVGQLRRRLAPLLE